MLIPKCLAPSGLGRNLGLHCSFPHFHGGHQSVRSGRKRKCISPGGLASLNGRFVIVHKRLAFLMRSAAHLARMVGIVEADKDAIKTCVSVPPDDEHAIEFSGGTVGVDFVNQCCPASGQSHMDDTVARSAIGEKFSPFHRFRCVPIANQGFGESLHFRHWAALIGRSCTLCLLSCNRRKEPNN
jgi:hypothetical protein